MTALVAWRLKVLNYCALIIVLGVCGSLKAAPHQERSDWLGNDVLRTADELERDATGLIKQGSLLRKEIKKKRQSNLLLQESHERQRAQNELAEQVEQSIALQKAGGSKRKQAAELRAKAVDQFAIDMQQRWPQWVRNKGSIELTDRFQSDAPSVGAHNTRARSVHPNKQSLAGAPQVSTAKSMTLALPELSSQQLPEGLDTRSFAISRERQFVAHIEVDTKSVASGKGSIDLNELHRWHLLLTDINGELVTSAEIEYLGHMPGHVHGLPTQPRITEQLAKGVYQISGVKFQMRGWWVIELRLSVDGFEKDSVRFNLNL